MIWLHPDIVSRIQNAVPTLVTVGGPYILAALPNNAIGPLLPAAIVVPGAGQFAPQNSLSYPDLETQDYQVVVVVPYQDDEATSGMAETIAAGYMRGVHQALHNHVFDKAKARRQMKYKGREVPSYNIGYAEFPMTFSIDAII